MHKIRVISNSRDLEETSPKLLKAWVSGFCNFYSLFLVFPYRFCWDNASRKVSLSSSKIQKILCVIAHTIVLLGSLAYLASIWVDFQNEYNGPRILFSCSTAIVCVFVYISFFYIIWKRQDVILEVIDWHTQNQKPIQLYKVGILCAVPLILPAIHNPLDVRYETFINFYALFDAFKDNSSGYNKLRRPVEWIVRMCLLYTHFFYLVSNALMIALIFPILQFVVAYKRKLHHLSNIAGEAPLQVIRLESEIRTVADLTSSIISTRVLLDYVVCLSYYATIYDIYDNSSKHSTPEKVHMILYFLFAGTFWACACELNFLVSSITKGWILQYKKIHLLRSPETLKNFDNCLLALQNDCDLNPTGISCRCFKISYGFLGSMFGLILTYSIIVYQMTSEIKHKAQGRNCTAT